MLDSKLYPPDITASEGAFFASLMNHDVQRSLYKDPVLQMQAKSLIPEERLKRDATEDEDIALCERERFLKQLMRWFKLEFFEWFDKAHCHACNCHTVNMGAVAPSTMEKVEGAGRVELYQCPQCDQVYRFPRYNHPTKLLQTRKGRCGEWANCFTLMCIACGFDARWLHLDCCENAFHTPLLYDKGWGKKLVYCIAFGGDHIQDVTKRYVANFNQAITRRLQCREINLVKFITDTNKDKLLQLDEGRQKGVQRRIFLELVEFICPKREDCGSLPGRISGDEEWREARGETGPGGETQGVVITPEGKELDNKCMIVCYCCGKDMYSRPGLQSTYRGFKSFTHQSINVMRKEEFDWRMVYLARQNNDDARISWKFKFPQNSKPSKISIKLDYKTFEGGEVVSTVVSGNECRPIRDSCFVLSGNDVESWTQFSLNIHLRGGSGDCAWQHTQLFRSPIMEDTVNMNIEMYWK